MTTVPPPSNNILTNAWRSLVAFLNRITEPHPAVEDIAERRQARLLSSLAVVFFVTLLSALVSVPPARRASNSLIVLAVLVVFSLVTYGISRSRRYKIGSVLLVSVILAGGLFASNSNISRTLIGFYALGYALGSVLLSQRSLALIMLLSLGAIFFIPVIAPTYSVSENLADFGLTMTLAILLLVSISFRDDLEKERLEKIQTTNRELEKLRRNLEQSVTERTRELSLAAQAGQTLAQVRSLDILLSQSVEMIQERFDLYYCQIYLVDAEKRMLRLRAGSGLIGRQLLERGFSLPLDLASLNGTAAIEKRTILVPDVRTEPMFRPNPLLPNTRAELVVPLIVSSRVVGILDLQSKRSEELSAERITAFEVLAGQLAVSILNAELFSNAERTRKEYEEQSRQLTRQNWGGYLDAIQLPEHFGYSYQDGKTQALQDPLADESQDVALRRPILLGGETIGHFRFDGIEKLDREQEELLATASRQVAQQIENLRLLGDADRYRAQAEEAARRLTREGWQSYFGRTSTLGYRYDHNQVQEIEVPGNNGGKSAMASPATSASDVVQPLAVQGEVIGELVISGIQDEQDAQSLVATIANQLSEHLEELRLFEDTQRALADVSEAQELVRRNQARLAQALELARMASWELNLRDAKLILNDQLYTLFGTNVELEGGYTLTSQEFLKRFVHKADHGRVTRRIRETMAQTFPSERNQIEMRIIRRDGQVRDMFLEYQVSVDADNRATLAAGYFLDITERKRAEEALRLSQERYEVAVAGSNDGLWDWEVPSNTVYFSPQWKAMLGYEDHEMVNDYDEFERRIHPEDHDRVLAAIDAYLKGEIPTYDIELRLQHKDGSYRWIRERGTAIRNAQGTALRMAGSHTDITAQREFTEIVARRARQLATVAEISTQVASILSPDEILQTATDLVKERFELYHSHIYLLDPGGQELTLAAGAGEAGRTMVNQGWHIHFDNEHSLVARAARTRQSVIVNDVRLSPDFLPNPLLPETRAELAVPLVTSEGVAGVLDVQSNQIGFFTEEDASIQTALAAQIAVSLQNARQYAQTQTRTEQLAVLNAMAVELTTLRDEAAIVDVVYEHTKRLMDTGNFFLALYDESSQNIHMPICFVDGEPLQLPPRKIGNALTDTVLRSRQPLLLRSADEVENKMRELRMDFVPLGNDRRPQSWMGVPMLYGDRVVGAIVVQSVVKPAKYDELDRDLLASIASQTAIALESARSFTQTQRQAEFESTINTISQRIQNTTTVENALQVAIRELGRALGSRRTSVQLSVAKNRGSQEKADNPEK